MIQYVIVGLVFLAALAPAMIKPRNGIGLGLDYPAGCFQNLIRRTS